jgi:Domain of unknown function (DUF4381)
MRSRPALVLLLVLAGSVATRGASAEEPTHVRASIVPQTAQLGERVTYRGMVVLNGGAGPAMIRWRRPDDGETLVWGALKPRYVQGRGKPRVGNAARGPAPAASAYDTAYVELPLQVFDTGLVSIPGLQFEVQSGSEWTPYRLPVVRLPIVPVLTAADSNADLRPLHGPLGAPWWERVPWLIVFGVMLVLVAAWLVWMRMRRRREAPGAVQAPVAIREDPATEALRELAALRRLQLPAAGRFADHAFALTRILRRYLERTRPTPRPGDTTPELVTHLASAGLDDADVRRIETLLRFWDRLKFARGAAAIEEARDAERAVEGLVRASQTPTRTEAA